MNPFLCCPENAAQVYGADCAVFLEKKPVKGYLCLRNRAFGQTFFCLFIPSRVGVLLDLHGPRSLLMETGMPPIYFCLFDH